MKYANARLRGLRNRVKALLKGRSVATGLSRLVSPALPDVICVDVGASYYPHVAWEFFLNSKNTNWLAVEPNKANLGYVDRWEWPCRISTCTTGLSREGGTQTLHVTNVDSGSSLLPPKILPSMTHRIRNVDYYFPFKERSIDTLTLIEALSAQPQGLPILVKLDTQGTELSILQGAKRLFDDRQIVGIEMESTMLADPIMKGSGKFWQACEYMEAQGFELMHVKPIHGVRETGRTQPAARTFLNECDAIFSLKQDVASGLEVEKRATLFGFYLTNAFYEEALALLTRDNVLRRYLLDRRCPIDEVVRRLKAAI